MSHPQQPTPEPQRSFASQLGRDMAESLVFGLMQIAYWALLLGIGGFIGYQVGDGVGLLVGLLGGAVLGGIGYGVLIALGVKEAVRVLFKKNSR